MKQRQFKLLEDTSVVPNDSWLYAQYVNILDIDSKDYFSGYIITNEGSSVPLIEINDKMWYLFVGTPEEVNKKIPDYDCILVYKAQDGQVTLRGQTLGM